MRFLVIGTNGQLGWELARSLLPLGTVVGLTRADLDLLDPDAIASAVRAAAPDVVFNAAAYTQVDQAETNETTALRINGEAVGIMAAEAARLGALFIHYSTDYVFNGKKIAPYQESDPVDPVNAYGRTKLEGERRISTSQGDWLIFRTTWVYAARGSNFMRTIIRLATEREELRVVGDQRGAPTPARLLADASAHAVRLALDERRRGTFESGLYHLTASGETTWHGFASAIVQTLRDHVPAIAVTTRSVDAIGSDQYPTPARRPMNSLLANDRFTRRFGLRLPDWQDGLRPTLQEALAR